MAKRLLDEDLRQANKSTSPLKTQAFKLANGTRYKSTAADGQAGKFAANNPAYPASYMNPNLRPQKWNGNQVVPLPSGPSYTANTNTRVRLGNGQVVFMPANATMSTPGIFGNVNPMLVPVQNGFAGVNIGYGTGKFIPKGMIMSDRVVVNQFPDVVSGSGFETRSPYPPVIKDPSYQTPPNPYTGTAGYWAGANQTKPSSYPAASYMNPNQQGQVNSTTTAAGTPNLGQPPRPEGAYNPNNKDTAAQWKAYWNWEAANPQAAAAIALAEGRLSSAPVVMTREQIWQMKAAQRRKRAGTETPSYVSPVTSPTPYTGTGNFYSTILNTGSG